MKKKSALVLVVLVVVFSILFITNLTLALFTDSKVNTGIIQFSQHKLDVEIVGADSIVLTPQELTVGASSSRTLIVSNPSNSISCVLRIWFEFLIEDEVNTEYLSFSISNTNFSISESGKYYYNSVLQSGARIDHLTLDFNVFSGDASEFEGKRYNVKLYIESMQANKEAVGLWNDDYSPDWYALVKNSLESN